MTNHDDTLLRVKGEKDFADKDELKLYIKKLASAVLTVQSKHGHATLKIVGAPSLNNAVKAIIIARGDAQKKGVDLVAMPIFDVANFDGQEKTAIVFRVEAR